MNDDWVDAMITTLEAILAAFVRLSDERDEARRIARALYRLLIEVEELDAKRASSWVVSGVDWVRVRANMTACRKLIGERRER